MKPLLALSLLLSTSVYSQETDIKMEMIPVYTIDVTETQINVVTTYSIDVYVDEKVYTLRAGFHTIFIESKNSRVMVLPNEKY